ncbi:MAG: hypothetical protein AAGF11_08190 [Myxococcota bacterium]
MGTDETLAAFVDAYDARDHDRLGALLGYPACCREFFREVVAQGFADPVWPYALRNRARESSEGVDCELHGDPRLNLLLRRIGVRAVPHTPCALDCASSLALADQFFDLGIRLGYHAELAWQREVLSWPMAWSMLHGIAEVKTPVFKLSCDTDGTAERYVVHWRGDGFPAEGARGLCFPYRRPEHLRVAESVSFQRGLIHPISLTTRGR